MRDNEVLGYVEATATIFFVEGHVACQYCPLLETYARDQCRRTGEYIVNTHTIGFDCPLAWKESEK